MDVTCQSCRATYKVDDAKIPPQGIKAKCPKCGHSFLLKKPDDVIAVSGDAAPAPAPAPAADPFAGFGAPPVPDFGGGAAAPPPAADPFAASFGAAAAPAPAPAADPFAGFGAAPAPGAPDPFAGGFGSSAPPPSDPFAASFAGGGFGSGGFDAPAPAPAPAGVGGLFNVKTAFEIKRNTGEQIGPYDLFTIKQMIYEAQLNGTEQLCDSAGNWVPITSFEDLGEIFRLTGAQAPSEGGGAGWGGAQPDGPKGGGWQKHESAAPAKAAPATPAAPAAPAPIVAKAKPDKAAPAPPVALGSGRKLGLGERVIIATESAWTFTKSPKGRILFGSIVGVIALSAVGYQFRWTIANAIGLGGRIEAAALVADGDRTLASGERGPMLTALGKYNQALGKWAESPEANARSAEVAATIWLRDPVRLDMKGLAEANAAKAVADGESYAGLRAQARVALAKRDFAAAEAALGKAAAAPEAAADPLLAVVRGDLLFEKGDMAGAEAAYGQAKGNPATLAHGSLGIALVKMRAGQYDAAKTALDEAVRAEPDNGTAKALQAYLSTRTGGDVAAARKALREIAASPLRFGVERSRASYFLGVLSEEAGQPAPALHHMRDAVRYYPSDPEALASAKRLFQARFPERPVDTWIAAISKVRGSTMMEKIQTGEIEFERRNWTAALPSLDSAAQGDPGSARAQFAIGRLLVEVSAQEKAKAKGHFERAMQADPDWAEPVIALARWELDAKNAAAARQLGEKALLIDPTLPDAYRVSAAAALAEKDYASAERSLQLAVEFDPEDYISWLDLGEARRLGGKPEDAIPAVEKAAALRPELAEPRVRLGRAYEALGQLDKASAYYAEAAKIEPANLEIATRAGVVAARGGNYLEARKRLEAVVKEQSSNAEAQYWLGVSYQQTGDPEKAGDAYRASIKAEYFDKYLAHFHLGELHGSPGSMRDVDAARDHLGKCLQLKPEFFQCIEEQANVAISENQYDEAIKLLNKVEQAIAKKPAAEKNPVIIRTLLRQGRIAKQQNKVREADGLYKKVLKLDAGNAEAYWNLGELIKDIDSRAAKTYYNRALKANPAYAPPYRDLGYLLKEEDNCRAAKAHLLKFIELALNKAEKKAVEDDLQNFDCQ